MDVVGLYLGPGGLPPATGHIFLGLAYLMEAMLMGLHKKHSPLDIAVHEVGLRPAAAVRKGGTEERWWGLAHLLATQPHSSPQSHHALSTQLLPLPTHVLTQMPVHTHLRSTCSTPWPPTLRQRLNHPCTLTCSLEFSHSPCVHPLPHPQYLFYAMAANAAAVFAEAAQPGAVLPSVARVGTQLLQGCWFCASARIVFEGGWVFLRHAARLPL